MAHMGSLAFVATLCCVSWGGNVEDSYAFMDQVLLQEMPGLVRSDKRLYPIVEIPEFKFKVNSTSVTNRELKVTMKKGAAQGFENGVHRTMDCFAPTSFADTTIVSCVLDFNGIYTTFLAKTEGDDLRGRRVPVNVTVVDTVGRFEASAAPGKAGFVRVFFIPTIRLRTVYGSNLHLDDARRMEFVRNIEEKVTTVLYDVLYDDYKNLLGRAIEGVAFPYL